MQPASRGGILTFALASTWGGMILSGPKACRGSTNDARIFPVFLHSPVGFQLSVDVIRAWQVQHLLRIDEGSGLLRPSGMLGRGGGGPGGLSGRICACAPEVRRVVTMQHAGGEMLRRARARQARCGSADTTRSLARPPSRSLSTHRHTSVARTHLASFKPHAFRQRAISIFRVILIGVVVRSGDSRGEQGQ
jgi:hypothetical protein